MPRRLSDHDLAKWRNAHGESIPVPPASRKRKNDESREQQAVVQWWALACKAHGLPEFILFSIPNGGARSAITGSILKREGARAGAPDLCLAVPTVKYNGLYIEMKHETGKLRPEQREFIDALRARGYMAGPAYGFADAKRFIEAYLRGETFA